jgi:hypothetical protein
MLDNEAEGVDKNDGSHSSKKACCKQTDIFSFVVAEVPVVCTIVFLFLLID